MKRLIFALAMLPGAAMAQQPQQSYAELAEAFTQAPCSAYLTPAGKSPIFQIITGAAIGRSENDAETPYLIEILSNQMTLCAVQTPTRRLVDVLRETPVR